MSKMCLICKISEVEMRSSGKNIDLEMLEHCIFDRSDLKHLQLIQAKSKIFFQAFLSVSCEDVSNVKYVTIIFLAYLFQNKLLGCYGKDHA